MGDRKLGKWTNPPLAYVVAEAAISPHYSVAQFIPTIQQSLRDVYPRTIDGMEVSLNFGSSGSSVPQAMWQLLTADSGRGVHVGTKAVALHATDYVDFPQFTDWLNVVLAAIESSGLNPFVERLGLRYIDFILPASAKDVRDYLVPSLRGVAPEGAGQPPQTVWACTFPFDGCTVNARIAAPASPGTLLPPNFNALPLARPGTMIEAEARVKNGTQIGFIDTDCTMPISQPFNAASLTSKFSSMHDCISATFKSFMSPLAEKEWV